MKFVCDQMLGSLATWLRLLGFDVFYVTADINDAELLHRAKQDNRTLITRDKQLVYQAKKQQIPVIKIQTIDLDQQLIHVLQGVSLHDAAILTRCSLCNSRIEIINKQDVQGKVPEKVFDHNNQFWHCKTCDKYYWTGSHYQKIRDKLTKLKQAQNKLKKQG